MTRIATMCGRLQQDAGLPALLDAAYEAFELMLPAVEDHQDPASGMFTQFVCAATRVADGRDAILFAPSLPQRPLHPAEVGGDGVANAATTQDIVTLSKVLCQVLGHAAGTRIGERDREACREAARCAEAVHRLLTGTGP
jgi:hypothetical protein